MQDLFPSPWLVNSHLHDGVHLFHLPTPQPADDEIHAVRGQKYSNQRTRADSKIRLDLMGIQHGQLCAGCGCQAACLAPCPFRRADPLTDFFGDPAMFASFLPTSAPKTWASATAVAALLVCAAAPLPVLAQAEASAAPDFPTGAQLLSASELDARLRGKVYTAALDNGASWRGEYKDSGYVFLTSAAA